MSQKSLTIHDGLYTITLSGYADVIGVMRKVTTSLAEKEMDNLTEQQFSLVAHSASGQKSRATLAGRSITLQPIGQSTASVNPKPQSWVSGARRMNGPSLATDTDAMPAADKAEPEEAVDKLASILNSLSDGDADTNAPDPTTQPETHSELSPDDEMTLALSSILKEAAEEPEPEPEPDPEPLPERQPDPRDALPEETYDVFSDLESDAFHDEDPDEIETETDNTPDIDRLFQKTEQRISSTKAVKGQNALNNFRAAVAVTQAEKREPNKNSAVLFANNDLRASIQDDLRAELQTGGKPTQLPTETPPVPAPQNAFSGGSFADYVAFHNADGLLDQVEAAAAYVYYVDGDHVIKRPKIIKLLTEHIGAELFDLDETLEALGRLVSQRRLVRMQPGEFKLHETSRFHPQ